MKPQSVSSVALLAGALVWIVGVTEASDDPTRSALDFFPKHLHDSSGKKVDPESLAGKVTALYFSARWCAPCRAFTPTLIAFRDRHQADDFEVVFVSFDRSNTDKSRYIREAGMEWLTLPGAKSRAARKLADHFAVDAYPTLIILSPDGAVISLTGKDDILASPEDALDRWKASLSS